jgi:hypothetical protein
VTESGQFPKPDLSMFEPKESREPVKSETDPGSITGVLPIVTEKEDTAKQRDDSAAGTHA